MHQRPNGVLLGNEVDTHGRWRDYFRDLLNAVNITPLNTQEVDLGEENNITSTEVFVAVKIMKAASCDEIRPQKLKALNRKGVIWLIG